MGVCVYVYVPSRPPRPPPGESCAPRAPVKTLSFMYFTYILFWIWALPDHRRVRALLLLTHQRPSSSSAVACPSLSCSELSSTIIGWELRSLRVSPPIFALKLDPLVLDALRAQCSRTWTEPGWALPDHHHRMRAPHGPCTRTCQIDYFRRRLP